MSNGEVLATLMMIGFCNYKGNYNKTEQLNKETNFHNLTDPNPNSI